MKSLRIKPPKRNQVQREMEALMGQTTTVLGDLIDAVSADQAAVPVTGLALDSRLVQPGDLFVALAGHKLDGRDFIDKAVAKGAAAIVAEAPCDASRWSLPVVAVPRLSERVSEIAGRFYANPSHAMSVIGVTGTNGKSSVTHYIAQVLESIGKPCGVIGTLGAGRISQLRGANNTTPDAISTQSTLAQWRDAGAKWAAMEVSSHGLVQHRVAAVQFSTAVFTNLTQDHLDYHGTMEAYGQAKSRLFTLPGLKHAVLNRDDKYSEVLRNAIPSGVEVISFGLGDGADVQASAIQYHSDGIKARITTPWGEFDLSSALCGVVNLKNVLAVIAVLGCEGFALADIAKAVTGLEPVPGRLERLPAADNVQVVIDYAHTPDALEQVLWSLRPHCSGRLWCVFGCGGDRDRGKRPLMAAVAEQLADKVVLTSDNPRSESPDAILSDIRAGLSHAPALQDTDRKRAIEFTVASAQPGDLVLIAGKGHEDYQETAGKRLPFSDVQCARLALSRRSSS